jgi:hypothetical protein
VRPGKTAAQGQDRILHRKGFVDVEAEFAAGVSYALGRIGESKRVRDWQHLFGVTGEIESRELAREAERLSRFKIDHQSTDFVISHGRRWWTMPFKFAPGMARPLIGFKARPSLA